MSLGRFLTLATLALCACRSSRHDEKYGKYDDQSTTAKSIDSHYGDAATRDAAATKEEMRTNMLQSTERDFVMQAVNGGKFEVESSQLALQKSVSGPHREFAQMMIEDHGRANRELEVLARNKGVMLTPDVDGELAHKLEELRQADGKEFERLYHDAQMKAHDDAVALFERAAKECTDPALKAFAQKTLPTLREHQRELQKTSIASSDERQ